MRKKRTEKTESEAANPPNFDRLRVVLVRVRNPLNIGAAARAMSNFGFAHLRLVNPYGPAFREAKSAVGAGEVLRRAQEYETVAEAVADCALVVGTTAIGKRQLRHPIRLLEPGAATLRKEMGRKEMGRKETSGKKKSAGNVALLFGSEKTGLTNSELSHCHWLMHIPTHPANISMNLGQAVAVCLYELSRERTAVAEADEENAASAELMERFTEVLFEALRASDYLKPKSPSPTEDKIRRRVRRLKLSTLDAEAWLGILRRFVWKMRDTESDEA